MYEIVLWLLAILALPKLIYAWIVQKKYRESLFKRLGRQFPAIDKGNRKLIWIHVVSVGEVKAVAVLAKRLKKEFVDSVVVISSITETGHAEAKRAIPEADYHVFLPYDFYWIICPIVKKVKPDYVLICETDFWYNFLRASKKVGAHISLVNGKISKTSMNRFKRFSFFARPLFSLVDLFALQSRLYADRFEYLGIPEGDIVVTGNLKFDSKPIYLTNDEKSALRTQLGISDTDKVIVIGSSHDTEEAMLLGTLKNILEKDSNVKVVVVPRHPERFNEVARLITYLFGSCRRYTNPVSGSSVILVDAMGILGKCYQIARVAIVAGSYTQVVGGHNILEPLWFGVPTIYGPYMYSQPDLVEAVSNYQAALQVPIDCVEGEVKELLQDESKRMKMRDASFQLIESMQGSTERTMRAILEHTSNVTSKD